ncbi:MAG: nitrate reductase molybdenum cofactor assembly chaperone [Robiginitomaculum sp.]|nr:MAG: nitrate reductase molybdenum cofactor assembly chaperone [Robiginitomaculum sp.]
MRSFRVLAHLLAYPEAELQTHMGELKTALTDEGLLKGKPLKNLLGFMDEFAAMDIILAQEQYVDLFDRGRAHCLHLFEHVHGESRFRGQAMIELAERYKTKGIEIGTGELPDYLPLMLEFISITGADEGLDLLEQAAPVIATIGEKLKRQKSGYAHIMNAIVTLSGANISKADIQKAADAALPDIKSLDELDEQWKEPEAFTGAPDCGTCDPDETPSPQLNGGM